MLIASLGACSLDVLGAGTGSDAMPAEDGGASSSGPSGDDATAMGPRVDPCKSVAVHVEIEVDAFPRADLCLATGGAMLPLP